jgi:DNA polymerase-3 subunit epsilon
MAAGWAERDITDVFWVCVDVETTGLKVEEGHRVCEVAAVKGTMEGQVSESTSLVNPAMPIPPEAAAVSGISDEDLTDAPAFADIASTAHGFLSDAVIVAHNAPFDAGFLQTEFEIAGLGLPPAPIIDTTVVAQSVLRLPVRNLPGVARALGLEAQPTHRALDDARATREVLLHGLRRLMRGGARTVGDVVEALLPAAPPGPRRPDDPLPVLHEALKNGADMEMTYEGSGKPSDRVIRPIRLEAYRGRLLLAAYCRERRAPRTFRLDRISRATLLPPEA